MDHSPYAGDSDVFGALRLDPVPKLTDDPAIGDPALVAIGEFVKAVMMARLNGAWSDTGAPSIGAGSDVVKTINYNNPEDNTFSLKDLPGLYVFRPTDKPVVTERFWDCQFWRKSYITVLWVPQPADQIPRAQRTTFFNAVNGAVIAAIVTDRFPGYVIPGDTDPFAANWGSSLMINAGLSKEIADDGGVEFKVIDVKIEMPAGAGKIKEHGEYEGARFDLCVYEDLDVSQTMRGAVAPPKLKATITENTDRTVEVFGFSGTTPADLT